MWWKIKHLATCLKNTVNFLIAKIYKIGSLGVFLYAHLHVQIQVFQNVKEHVVVAVVAKLNSFVLRVVASKAWHDLHPLQILSN